MRTTLNEELNEVATLDTEDLRSWLASNDRNGDFDDATRDQLLESLETLRDDEPNMLCRHCGTEDAQSGRSGECYNCFDNDVRGA